MKKEHKLAIGTGILGLVVGYLSGTYFEKRSYERQMTNNIFGAIHQQQAAMDERRKEFDQQWDSFGRKK